MKKEKFMSSGKNIPFNTQVVGERLTTLAEQNQGRLTLQIVLEDSRKDDSVLHDCFEWDDRKAAEKHRSEQARHIINNTVVRAFVNVRQDKAGNLTDNPYAARSSYYVTVESAMQDDSLKERALAMAFRELHLFKKKYGSLQKLAKLFDVVDELAGS